MDENRVVIYPVYYPQPEKSLTMITWRLGSELGIKLSKTVGLSENSRQDDIRRFDIRRIAGTPAVQSTSVRPSVPPYVTDSTALRRSASREWRGALWCIVGSARAFGSIGHGFDSKHRLFSHHCASAFNKLRSLSKCSLDDSVRRLL